MRRHRSRRKNKQIKIIMISSICLLLIMTVGYAAFSTNLNITAKGNIIKNPLAGPTDEVITNLVETNPEEVYIDDNNNIRYYGKDPNNYVYFNCTDINNQTSDTCELWRIMGIIDGKVKLIRNEAIPIVTTDIQNGESVTIGESGGFYWNYVQQEGKNYNNWEGSTLQNYLNGTYYSSINANYQKMISPSIFYLGGPNSSNWTTLTAKGYYDAERDGTQVYSGNPASTEQHIGLMYPSDYGYATSGGSTTDKNSCLNKELLNWDSSSYSDCKNNDYLYSGKSEWLQAPFASYSNVAMRLDLSGEVNSGYNVNIKLYLYQVRPVLYLTSGTQILTGQGTINDPFQLS